MARIAQGQYDAYHQLRESDPKLAGQIRRYWTDLGFPFPGVQTAWSAIFVSWCLQQAGATPDEFLFSPMHAEFVHQAIQNGIQGRGVFRAYDIKSYAPRIGDIIQNNRDGNKYDFAYAKHHSRYVSHSAIVVATGRDARGNRYVVTVGGNEADSVGRKRVEVDKSGKVVQRRQNPYICVIQNFKGGFGHK